ncbi:MAG TPA: hypothetical protein PKZ00_03795 [Elusimicrobiota bacterium]|jgi:hypothetical protein|nr:hypothetical protein [Elusimicrobiota bacterium]
MLPKNQAEELLGLLDGVERELKTLGFWPVVRPRVQPEWEEPEIVLKFDLLPQHRALLRENRRPAFSSLDSLVYNLKYRLEGHTETAPLLTAMEKYRERLDALIPPEERPPAHPPTPAYTLTVQFPSDTIQKSFDRVYDKLKAAYRARGLPRGQVSLAELEAAFPNRVRIELEWDLERNLLEPLKNSLGIDFDGTPLVEYRGPRAGEPLDVKIHFRAQNIKDAVFPKGSVLTALPDGGEPALFDGSAYRPRWE